MIFDSILQTHEKVYFLKDNLSNYEEKRNQKEENLSINLLNESPHKMESEEQIKTTRLWHKYKDF